MADPAEAQSYIAKAAESLASAQDDFRAGRYNSYANRAYYTCFQTAIAALLVANVQPANPRGEWSHELAQSQFDGLLVNRRKLYPASLRRVLRDTIEVREKADYTASSVNERVARRVLQQAQDFFHAVRESVR